MDEQAGRGTAVAGAPLVEACGGLSEQACGALPGEPDLTWLLHRSAQRLRGVLDDVAAEQGLAGGLRDWIVLSAIQAVPGRTQLALAHELGLDKTTTTSLLDRLERDGLVVRRQDPKDRRARLPEVTERGRKVQERVTRARDRAEAEVLAGFRPEERALLRELLTRLADGQAGPGSCM